ncbi:MAG: hypothetical protein N3A66_10205, partial [Planctomycetota bacterium]|nr:hypothetical protein [Planctomycetota bacterium]
MEEESAPPLNTVQEEEAADDLAALRGEAGARNQVTADSNEVPALRAAEVAPEMTVDADNPPATQPPGQGALAVPAGKQILPREVSAETLERLAKIEERAPSSPAAFQPQAPQAKSARASAEEGEEITDLPDWAK